MTGQHTTSLHISFHYAIMENDLIQHIPKEIRNENERLSVCFLYVPEKFLQIAFLIYFLGLHMEYVGKLLTKCKKFSYSSTNLTTVLALLLTCGKVFCTFDMSR